MLTKVLTAIVMSGALWVSGDAVSKQFDCCPFTGCPFSASSCKPKASPGCCSSTTPVKADDCCSPPSAAKALTPSCCESN